MNFQLWEIQCAGGAQLVLTSHLSVVTERVRHPHPNGWPFLGPAPGGGWTWSVHTSSRTTGDIFRSGHFRPRVPGAG